MGRGGDAYNGQSIGGGPTAIYRKNGLCYRPVTLWDLIQGRDPE